MLMARSTYEGMELADKNKRPFVLTRAGFIGSQRYAATWTGDNLSNWEHLHMSISMVLQLGLSGQPLSGPDIGGFAGNATPRLFGRWMGVGAMFPFCRGHSEAGTDDHEPWSFGEECEEVCRAALKRRYQLLPHFYTLFYIAHTTGAPVAAPIFFADPIDSRLRAVENGFLLGPLLIYASTLSSQGSHELQHILPRGIWHRFDFADSHPVWLLRVVIVVSSFFAKDLTLFFLYFSHVGCLFHGVRIYQLYIYKGDPSYHWLLHICMLGSLVCQMT
jgi:alpha-glucosidase